MRKRAQIGVDLPGSLNPDALFNLLLLQTVTSPNQLGTPMEVGAAPGICYPGIAYDCTWIGAAYKAPREFPV